MLENGIENVSSCISEDTERELSELKTAFKLEQRKMLENLIAGALFDFAGYLTTRSQAVTFSASHDPLPAVTLVVEFLKLRGISTNCKPEVVAWDKLIDK